MANIVEALNEAKLGDVKTTAQVQQTLQRAASITIELKARVGAMEVTHEQVESMAERAQWTSEEAIQEAKTLQIVQ